MVSVLNILLCSKRVKDSWLAFCFPEQISSTLKPISQILFLGNNILRLSVSSAYIFSRFTYSIELLSPHAHLQGINQPAGFLILYSQEGIL